MSKKEKEDVENPPIPLWEKRRRRKSNIKLVILLICLAACAIAYAWAVSTRLSRELSAYCKGAEPVKEVAVDFNRCRSVPGVDASELNKCAELIKKCKCGEVKTKK